MDEKHVEIRKKGSKTPLIVLSPLKKEIEFELFLNEMKKIQSSELKKAEEEKFKQKKSGLIVFFA